MSWDVAVYGELTFPSTEAMARWRTADVDPSPESPFRGDGICGSVDGVLKSLAGGLLDWLEALDSGNTVSIQGQLTKDTYNAEAPSVVAALRAAWDVGGRGEVWIVGLGTDLSYLLRVGEHRSIQRTRADSTDPRLTAVITESGRRAALHRAAGPSLPAEIAPALRTLSQSKDPASAIATLEDAPKGEYWKEFILVDKQLPELHARFGADVVPVIVAILARRGWAGDDVVKVLFDVATPAATDLLAEMLGPPLTTADIATLLLARPDLSLPPLRRMADWPDTQRGPYVGTDRLIAPSNELARRLIAELSGMTVADAAALPATLQSKSRGRPPKWFHPAAFARVRLASGAPLSTDASKRLVVFLKSLKDGDPTTLDVSAFDRRSLDTLLFELFVVWCASGAGKAERYVAVAIRSLGGEQIREQLALLAGEPTVAGRQARAILDG